MSPPFAVSVATLAQVEPVRFGGDVPDVPHEQTNRLVCGGEEGLVGVPEHAIVVLYDDLFFDGAQVHSLTALAIAVGTQDLQAAVVTSPRQRKRDL